MSNIKKREFYDVYTGENVDEENYGIDASVFRKVDNVVLIFDSRGEYLGTRTCRGKLENGKYIVKKGPCDFRSFIDLKIWKGRRCNSADFIETKDGNFMQIRQS